MRPLLIAAIVVGAVAAPAGGAPGTYENEPTHRSMTLWGVGLAGVAGYEEVRAFEKLIVDGSVAEDEGTRYMRHFWNPDAPANENGLPMNSYTRVALEGLPPAVLETRYTDGLTWARDGMPDGRHWYGAIEKYGYTPAQRGAAYDALGHVVHMVQDMGQPDHVMNRPHGGGHTHEKIAMISETWAEVVAPSDRLAYETLWVYNHEKWPRGKIARKPLSLEAAFNELARESIRTMKHEGLLHDKPGDVPKEIALGLSVLQFENYNQPVRIAAKAGVKTAGRVWRLATPQLEGLRAVRTLARWHDEQWRFCESNIALQPLIPWPATAETQPYLNVGNKLIPLAEEYGAGMMQLFHDIVNHPPIVQEVIILQEGRERYRKAWIDGRDARTLQAIADAPLTRGVEAEIRITFGPSRGRPELQEPVTDIHVAVQGGSGPPGEIRGAVISGSNEAVVWRGSFKPESPGTLVIAAKDTHAHFEKRKHKGDTLDADPATYALARPPAPFEWTGYEPGEDRNHAFTVEGGCGVCSAFRRYADTFVSGTLKGSLTTHSENRDGGLKEFKGHVTFRCIRPGQPWDRLKQGNTWVIGVPKGFFSARWRYDRRTEIEEYSGATVKGGGHIEHVEGCRGAGHEFSIALIDTKYRARDFGGEGRGKVSDGLNLKGEHTDLNGARTTWDFTFEPTPAPEHFQVASRIMDPGRIGTAFANYIRQDWSALDPALAALNAEQFKQLKEQMEGVAREWSQAMGASRAVADISDAYHDAEQAWVHLDPEDDPDRQYRAAVEKLRAGVAEFQELKKTWEGKFAAVSRRVADRIEAVNADAAKKMRAQADQLTSKGVESFGDSK